MKRVIQATKLKQMNRKALKIKMMELKLMKMMELKPMKMIIGKRKRKQMIVLIINAKNTISLNTLSPLVKNTMKNKMIAMKSMKSMMKMMKKMKTKVVMMMMQRMIAMMKITVGQMKRLKK